MKQETFEKLHQADWKAFELWLEQAGKRRKPTTSALPFPVEEFPERYRMLCQHLALARDRDYSLSLLTHLHRLVLAGHDPLYGARAHFGRSVLFYARSGFARDVRAHSGWILAAFLLLFGSSLLMMMAVRQHPDLAYLVMGPEQVAHMEAMYDTKASSDYLAREAATDFSMFGFYIYNNVSIAFRCFAGGLAAGLLSCLALLYNGLVFGVVEARLALAGLDRNFYSFVIGHAGFELGAIVLAGAAGLRLGCALLVPGRRRRAEALRDTASSLIGMICGLAVMLFIAALIEAFWSPLRLSFALKIGVGSVLCLLPLLYFVFAGRQNEP